ncbi:MAG: SDR family oxidoreductase [Acidimicrobiales bacterium]|nr:SDR family oxidoreductase [Acidimicrobiales bacterium]
MTRALVTGGAGFVGSHLCRRLLDEGWEVVCIDSLLTGAAENVADLVGRDGFSFQRYDVTNYLAVPGPLEWVLHLASPASPRDYLEHPIHTLKVGALGTLHAIGLARAKGAGFFLASTSEVYGDPQVHPQPESYWGNVHTTGPRGVYDEAKRFAEAMVMAYHRAHDLNVRIARIFNTYGPGMRRYDGRAVPTFIDQVLKDQPLTVHGDGSQTRSLCYVADLVEGIWRVLGADLVGPVNLGNPEEVTVLELAKAIRELCGSSSDVAFVPRPEDDPGVRCPDISLARSALHWEPGVPLQEGLTRTFAWAREAWA